MKIKWGALVVDGRNKIGGHVASKNRSGAYLRTKVTPVNPNTAFQSAVRASFGAFSQAWSSLSAALILAWNAAVADWQTTDIFGDLKKPTGKNLFLRLNQQATQGGYASFTAVPGKLEMVEGAITAAVFAQNDTGLNLTGAYTGADARIMIYGTPTLSAGTSFVTNKLRLVDTQLCSTYSAADADTAYTARFGESVTGGNVVFGFRYCLSNGQVSPMQIVKAVVTVS